MPPCRSTPVLVVDERATTVRILTDILEGLGFSSIETTRDGAAALAILRDSGPRLIIADFHMLPVSGLHLLRTIRSDEKLRKCPFIMSAAKLSPEQAALVKHAGANGIILKPCTRAAVAAKVQEVVANRGDLRRRIDTPHTDAVSASLEKHLAGREQS